MLCGCVPVVTPVGAMPEVVNGVGYIVSKKEEVCVNIAKALDNFPELSKMARELIYSNYSIWKREKFLLKLLNEN